MDHRWTTGGHRWESLHVTTDGHWWVTMGCQYGKLHKIKFLELNTSLKLIVFSLVGRFKVELSIGKHYV